LETILYLQNEGKIVETVFIGFHHVIILSPHLFYLILQKLFKIGKLLKVFRKLDLLTVRTGKLRTHPSLPQIGLAHRQNQQTSNSSKQKNALHVVMCKYYSSYMVIIYAPSSKQASSTWRMMMYLNRDMDGGPFLVYFLPILGGQKAAVSDSVEGWCAASNLGASRVSIRMDDRTDG
jgi:hypothetical protein